MNEIVITTDAPLSVPSALDRAKHYAGQGKAENTTTAYASDFRQFDKWCHSKGYPSLPTTAAAFVEYLAHLADSGRKVATIERAHVGILKAHKNANLPTPNTEASREVMEGIRRQLGKGQEGKAAATVEIIRRMVATCEKADKPKGRSKKAEGEAEEDKRIHLGIRDRALLLLGFAGAFRRSELVALNVEDLAFVAEGLTVTIRRSKTDQEGQGVKIGIPYGHDDTCPVNALRAWLKVANIKQGAIFRGVNRHGDISDERLSSKGVARAVKRAANLAGLDESLFSGHSLRAGLATSAAAAGVEERDIANQTRHKSMTVLRRYIRDGSLFRSNAASKVGL